MAIRKDKNTYIETFNILRRAKKENRLVLFVGAGASVDSSMPLWSQVINEISKVLSLPQEDNDFLKIPQYYYNSRGKKEYNDLMRRIFKYGEDLNTTDLHKAIIDFGTKTIITTNYDHLIEKAAQENGEVMQVICQDIDLPYLCSGRQLIKIHGDFEHDNYVLKEDDYLHYSSNFKLIETYIKSLIGSRVVLFIGYSLNDPDVKHIFSWAKEVLNENFQRAYIIITKEEPNDIKKEYFKNLGVNIIYASELIEKKDSTHSEQIINALNLINAKDTITKSKIESLYYQFKPFQDLNYVYGKYIRKALFSCNIVCYDNSISLFCKEDDKELRKFHNTLWNCFKKNVIPKNVDAGQIGLIKQVVLKSHFCNITKRDKLSNCSFEISNQNSNDIENMVINFDYQSLHSIMENNLRNVSVSNPEICMQQAYICSVLGDYVLAYTYLKSASVMFYSRRSYIWYYIAMFNKKYVGELLSNPYIGELASEERQIIVSEAKAIDLDKILNSFPNADDSDYSFLKELGTFNVAYTLFYDLFKDSVKVTEEANTNYSVYIGTAAYMKLQIAVKDYINYIYRNYIILDRYTEMISIFVLYIRSILSSVNSTDLRPISNDEMAVGNVRLERIGKFELFIMIKYLHSSEIHKMFKEYDIRIIPVDEEGFEYLHKIFASISDAYKYIKEEIWREDIFWRYLEIVSHIEITDDLAFMIFGKLNTISARDLDINSSIIARFLANVCSQHLYSESRICDAANLLIDTIIDNKRFVDVRSILNRLSYISYKGSKAYDDETRITQLAKAKNNQLMIDLFDKLGENAQKVIKKEMLKLNLQKNALNYRQYCEAVLAGILEQNVQTESEIIDWLRKQIQNEQTSANVDYYSVINALTNLYLNNKIIDCDSLKEVIYGSSNESSKWLINIDDYDYSNFDCMWLETCTESLLERIAKSQIAVKGILKSYKTQFFSKAINAKITDIIVNHFIDT